MDELFNEYMDPDAINCARGDYTEEGDWYEDSEVENPPVEDWYGEDITMDY